MPKLRRYVPVGDPRRYLVTYRGQPMKATFTEEQAREKAYELNGQGYDSVGYWQIMDYPYAELGQYLHFLGSGDDPTPAVTGVGT